MYTFLTHKVYCIGIRNKKCNIAVAVNFKQNLCDKK